MSKKKNGENYKLGRYKGDPYLLEDFPLPNLSYNMLL
jgi:hypothetical protein